jgi:hypothetical protein
MANLQYPRTKFDNYGGVLADSVESMLPVVMNSFDDLQGAANAEGMEGSSNGEINATFLAANGTQVDDKMSGMPIFTATFNLDTGASLYLDEQTRRDITIATPSMVNKFLERVYMAAGSQMATLYPGGVDHNGTHTPFHHLDKATRESYAYTTIRDRISLSSSSPDYEAALHIANLFRAEQIGEAFKYQGSYTVSDIDNTPHTVTVGGRCMHTKSIFTGSQTTMPNANVGVIFTRELNPVSKTYDGPYRMKAWSSKDSNTYPSIHETCCLDYFGRFDPGLYVPFGASLDPALFGGRSSAAYNMGSFGVYGYADKMLSPNVETAMRSIGAAPTYHLLTNRRSVLLGA